MEMDHACIVTETCRHCKSEIEMKWDTGKWGFSAFCPACGRRIMLCNACRRAGDAKPCDYDRVRNRCWRNPPMPRRRDTPAITLRAGTPLGAIIARAATDPDHPGIYVDLRRTDASADMPLALIEFAADEGDLPEGRPNIITRVWGDAAREDYTFRAVHGGIGKFFSTEEPDEWRDGMERPEAHEEIAAQPWQDGGCEEAGLIGIRSGVELEWMKRFVLENGLDDEICREQLRALWTAYCLRHGFEPDTGKYDADLRQLWMVAAAMKTDLEDTGWLDYDSFDGYMCRHLV